jgi:hypothetical protein
VRLRGERGRYTWLRGRPTRNVAACVAGPCAARSLPPPLPNGHFDRLNLGRSHRHRQEGLHRPHLPPTTVHAGRAGLIRWPASRHRLRSPRYKLLAPPRRAAPTSHIASLPSVSLAAANARRTRTPTARTRHFSCWVRGAGRRRLDQVDGVRADAEGGGRGGAGGRGRAVPWSRAGGVRDGRAATRTRRGRHLAHAAVPVPRHQRHHHLHRRVVTLPAERRRSSVGPFVCPRRRRRRRRHRSRRSGRGDRAGRDPACGCVAGACGDAPGGSEGRGRRCCRGAGASGGGPHYRGGAGAARRGGRGLLDFKVDLDAASEGRGAGGGRGCRD